MTYVLLSAAFVLAAVLILGAGLIRSGRAGAVARSWWLPAVCAGVALFVLTAIFDNVMIAVGLFEYDWANTSGIRIGRAPIEDFTYPLAAVIVLPGLWLLLAPRRDQAARDAHDKEGS